MTESISPKGNLVYFPVGKPTSKVKSISPKNGIKTQTETEQSPAVVTKLKSKKQNAYEALKIADEANKSLIELNKLEEAKKSVENLMSKLNSAGSTGLFSSIRKAAKELGKSSLFEEAQLIKSYLPEVKDTDLKVVPISLEAGTELGLEKPEQADLDDMQASLQVVLESITSRIKAIKTERTQMAAEIAREESEQLEFNPEEALNLAQKIVTDISKDPNSVDIAAPKDFSLVALLKDPA